MSTKDFVYTRPRSNGKPNAPGTDLEKERATIMTDGTTFTERELDIMSVLWRSGSGTVAEVREALAQDLGYTSVLKMLQILEDKGMIRHEQEGRAYRYFPVVEPGEAGGHALGRIVDKIFQGSAELALARLVSGRALEPDEVERMKAMLDEVVEEDAGERADAGQREEDVGKEDDDGGGDAGGGENVRWGADAGTGGER